MATHRRRETSPISKTQQTLRDVRASYALARELNNIENETAQEIYKQLAENYDETRALLYAATGVWDITRAIAILAELQRQQNTLQLVMQDQVNDAIQEALDEGLKAPLKYLTKAGLEISTAPVIDTGFVSVAFQTLPTLIKGLTDAQYADVARILRQGVIAGEDPYQIVRDLGQLPPFRPTRLVLKMIDGHEVPVIEPVPLSRADEIRAAEGKGPWAKTYQRMTTIMRTEVGRIAQMANYGSLAKLAETFPELQKEWSAIIDNRTRPDHAAANGQRVPVKQPFMVGGFPLMFPHDPRAPGKETINCRCTALPWHPSFAADGPAHLGQSAVDSADRGHTPVLPDLVGRLATDAVTKAAEIALGGG